MPPQEIARQWFVPGDGIDRHVISADIQRYLGNDATVRPGVGTAEHQGVQGYWIKAYRNLTSAMIADLRADSARWRQEQRQTGTRGSTSPIYHSSGTSGPDLLLEPYVSSSTYQSSTAGRAPHSRPQADSPSVEGPYGLPPTSRISVERMQVDPPQPSRGGVNGNNGSGAVFPPDNHPSQYPPDNRAFPSGVRGYAPDGRPTYQPEPAGGFPGRAPPISAPQYSQEPRYAPSGYSQGPPEGNHPGYVRQQNYVMPVSSYESKPSIPTRSDNYGPGGAFGQPQPSGRDPRGYQQPEYADPSAYGSMPSNYDNYDNRRKYR